MRHGATSFWTAALLQRPSHQLPPEPTPRASARQSALRVAARADPEAAPAPPRPPSLTVALGSVGHAEEQGGIAAELREKGGQRRRGRPSRRGVEGGGGRRRGARGAGDGRGGRARGAASGFGAGVPGSVESHTRGAARSRAPSGGREAWFTLMSGETCTGGTILSVTFAPEEHPGALGERVTSPGAGWAARARWPRHAGGFPG